MLPSDTPADEMSTYVSTPDALAWLASARLRSTSILRCASTEPACRFEVPSAEKRMEGVGERDEM